MCTLIPLVSLAILAAGAADPAGGEKVVPAFTPASDAALAYATGQWQVWTVRDQVDNRPRAPRFRVRYYLQRPGEPNATLLLEMRNHIPRVLTVLPDRTALLDGVTYVDPDGSTTTEPPNLDGERAHILRGDPDGVLMQPYRLNRAAPVYFVPIKGRRLDPAARILVTDEAGVSVNSPPRFLRGPHAFAWKDQVFDLETRARKRFPVNPLPMAFDGATVVYFDVKPGESFYLRRAFSVADGTELGVTSLESDPAVDFAVKDRVVYTFAKPRVVPRGLALEAVDLNVEGGRITPLLTLPRGRQDQGMHEVDTPRVITREGIDVWDGKAWRKIKWLGPSP